jgi:hypothetical protein
MLWVEFEPTIRAFEQAKTIYVLDRKTTVIDSVCLQLSINKAYLEELLNAFILWDIWFSDFVHRPDFS